MSTRSAGDERAECAIRNVLDRIGDRWSVLVLCELEQGTLRFTALKSRIGDISQRMLAQTLRKLEQDGFVSRRVYPTIPPRVEYSLTRLGLSLLKPLHAMIRWAESNHAQVRSARAEYVPPPPQHAQ
jgi:DNA-binding HxlR family transcriptional regulator